MLAFIELTPQPYAFKGMTGNLNPHFAFSSSSSPTIYRRMGNDVVLRICLIWLAAIMVLTAMYTQSLKKTAATYLFGMLAIGGVVLPDWNFFDRPLSHWCTVVSDDGPTQSAPPRMKLYPVRVVIYTAVYGYGFHEWLNYITS